MTSATPEVLLVHPGGPFWRNRDRGAWQLPKGLIEPGESPEEAARREAQEELGVQLEGPLRLLGCLKQKGGKIVEAFALEHDLDPAKIAGNWFSMEWPPRSGRLQTFPESDAARWFDLNDAYDWILSSQAPFLERLRALLS
jgi:predicted NUDIX family NTP pyrophosphohydrolase